jgi:hypothetical protein
MPPEEAWLQHHGDQSHLQQQLLQPSILPGTSTAPAVLDIGPTQPSATFKMKMFDDEIKVGALIL